MARCECAACGERFSGVSAFDLHQEFPAICHFPAERGLERRPDGIWGWPRRGDGPETRAGSQIPASQGQSGTEG
jgi:hypothetical protein